MNKKVSKKQEKTDYGTYTLSWKEWILFLAEAALLCSAANYLFYKTWTAFLFMLPFPFWYIPMRRRQRADKRRKQLYYQFKDGLNAVRVGIASGYSLENALGEAVKDMEKIYGKQGAITQEFAYMQRQIRLSVPAEDLFYDLGIRSRTEDIMNFSEILIQSRKMGGNMKEILQNCIVSMEERIDAKKEIDAALAARKMEQKIMSLIPLGIILYLQTTSPEFLGVLYKNPAGAGVMTVCLAVYLAAYRWGERLVDIEV